VSLRVWFAELSEAEIGSMEGVALVKPQVRWVLRLRARLDFGIVSER